MRSQLVTVLTEFTYYKDGLDDLFVVAFRNDAGAEEYHELRCVHENELNIDGFLYERSERPWTQFNENGFIPESSGMIITSDNEIHLVAATLCYNDVQNMRRIVAYDITERELPLELRKMHQIDYLNSGNAIPLKLKIR